MKNTNSDKPIAFLAAVGSIGDVKPSRTKLYRKRYWAERWAQEKERWWGGVSSVTPPYARPEPDMETAQ